MVLVTEQYILNCIGLVSLIMMMTMMMKWEGYGKKWSRPILKHTPTLPHMNLNIHAENIRFHSGDGKRQGHDYIIYKLYVNIL